MVGVRVPGMSRVTRFVEAIQFPWEPPKPVHVPLPEGAVAAVPAPAVQAQPPAVAPPVAAPAAAAVPTPHPALAQPLPASFTLPGQIRHQWQTWNNCGPATITMATSYFGRPEMQAQAATVLKPNPNDKNVGVDELAAYARSLGLRADNLYLGDLTKLKRLVTNGVPVVISMWYTPHPNDGLGHYRLLTGYDDAAQQLIFHDSFQAPGVNLRIGYAAFDNDWRVYQRAYMPVYSPEKADVVAAIVGPDMDEAQLRQRAVVVAQEELSGKQNDAFAWFNVGTALTRVGRTTEAVQAFDRARALLLPWRMLWYQFAQFEAYLAENRPNDVLALTQANLAQAPELEESHYFRGRALELQGNKVGARAAYQTALQMNPKFAPAAHALSLLG
ncbi:MAG TPA: C39 family peptidase, partial [Chloroflexota bacterium]|nr:C39 family peptidase [Chloroflexota bacterium]